MNMYRVYTDGSSNGKKGFGGCAAIITKDMKTGVLITRFIGKEIGNNYAEVCAVYIALEYLPAQSSIALFTDSQNVIGWLEKNWNRTDKDINLIVSRTLQLQQKKDIKITYHWVKGHSTNPYNNWCDKAAKEARHSGVGKTKEIQL